jgi:serine/threonine protein kinase
MDYCEGQSLGKYVDNATDVSPRRIYQIYMSLIKALEHVHQHGIIHGDLKPSNVMVRSNGTPVLLDFGSARQEMLRMAVGQVSDGYSPPEFYETSGKVGPWSDIYGLGATFYKLITGVKVPLATERSKFDSYSPVANSITDGYSPKFLDLIDNSLKLPTFERPQSISSIVRLLPEIENFSKRLNFRKDLRSERPKVLYPKPVFLNWKVPVSAMGIIVMALLGYAFVNQTEKEAHEIDVPKVSPIKIDDVPTIAESTVSAPKNSESSTVGNVALQQALTFLAKVSTSTDISWYSIPSTDSATRSFKFVTNEIEKKFDSAIERKNYSYIESSKEFLLKDISISDVKSFGFTATDSNCSVRPIGPVAATCRKFGRDFKCRFTDLSTKYEQICLSYFSVQ